MKKPYIKVKVGIVKEETADRNEITGKETYADDEVIIVDCRLVIEKVMYWEPYRGGDEQTQIGLVSGDLLVIQESADSFDKKYEAALYIPNA